MDCRFLAPLTMLAASAPAIAARPPAIPDDAPTCAAPGARQLFLSPMGEPFRAAAGALYPSAAWAKAADADGDGTVDRNEFVAEARRFFATLDTDHDGRLVPEEIIAYERDVAPEIAIAARGPETLADARSRRRGVFGDLVGGGSSRTQSANYGGAMGAGRYAWLNIPEPVVSADADVNRIVDAAEFAAAAGRRFDALDTARSGRLRLAGLARTMAQQASEGPCHPRPAPRAGEERPS